MSSRRHFVSGLALSTCALLLNPAPRGWKSSKVAQRLGSALGLVRRDPSEFSSDTFTAHTGEQFALSAPGKPTLGVKLREVVVYKESRIQGGRRLEQFSLLFEGPSVEGLEQGNFVLDHPDQGECELFVVPIGPEGKRRSYQASFSRLV